MKKAILILAIALGAINLHAQDSTFIYYFVDELEDKTYYMPSSDLIITNSAKTEGAKISFHLTDKGVFSFLTAKLVGLGNCYEDNKMIILFEDGLKITLTSWNKFNCDGDAYFSLNAEQRLSLSTLPIKTIRVTNGYTFESITVSEGYNKKYFIQTFHCIDNKVFTLFED